MRIKEKLRRMREVLQPSVRAGMSAASGKAAYPHERRGTGRQPEMVYISVPGCLREDDVRTTMEAVRDVYRSGRIPVCPCVMFPSDSVFGAVDAQSERKMRLRLMDVCESILKWSPCQDHG